MNLKEENSSRTFTKKNVINKGNKESEVIKML